MKSRLLAFLGAALLTTAGQAATLSVTWQHPTMRTDGTPLALSEIGHTLVEYGDCSAPGVWGSRQGSVEVPAPATGVQITAAGWGDKCVRGYTVTTTGVSSDASGVAYKTVPEPPPEPPTLTAVETVVYEIQVNPAHGTRVARAVGTVALGAACGEEIIVWGDARGNYHEVSVDQVTFTRAPKSAIVVAKCA